MSRPVGNRQWAALAYLEHHRSLGARNMQRPLAALLGRGRYLPCAETQAIMQSLWRRGYISHTGGVYRITEEGRIALSERAPP